MTDTKVAQINWMNSVFLIATPVLATLGIILHWVYFGSPGLLELIVFLSLYFACGLSITVGYHRLFSHRSHTVDGLLCYSTQYLEQVRSKTRLLNGAQIIDAITK